MKKETDLFAPIKAFWLDRGYVVNAEVKGYDITLTDQAKNQLIIIETKLHFNMTLLYQAIEAQKVADFVYIAIPAKPYKELAKITHILTSLNLGLITVSSKGFINIALGQETAYQTNPKRRLNTKKQAAIKKEIQGRHIDTNIGGSKGKKLITSYKEKAIHIALALQQAHSQGMAHISPAMLVKQYACPKDTGRLLLQNSQAWYKRLGKAQYALDKIGAKALKLPEYEKAVEFYRGIINNETK